MEMTALTVTQVTRRIKNILESDELLSGVLVKGEISNFKLHSSGHMYFTLKDEGAVIRCVMFRSSVSRLRFMPENGMKVVIQGSVSVFERGGDYQLYCTNITPDGVGALYVAFEQLKNKLQAEGLFSKEYKKPLPGYPQKIAVVTSPTGAAIQDMLRILRARWPVASVTVFPVHVQGTEAAGEIAAAISIANKMKIYDLIITGRGGGSIEDLWPFNEEIVARAIFASKLPVISAVGHEPDVTISDFVADLRAATPSNAAELAVPDINEVLARLDTFSAKAKGSLAAEIKLYRQRLKNLSEKRVLTSPLNYIYDKRMLLDRIQRDFIFASQSAIGKEKNRFMALAAKLDALSPLKVLGRGYSLAVTDDGKTVKCRSDLPAGSRFTLKVSDGQVLCEAIGEENG